MACNVLWYKSNTFGRLQSNRCQNIKVNILSLSYNIWLVISEYQSDHAVEKIYLLLKYIIVCTSTTLQIQLQ